MVTVVLRLNAEDGSRLWLRFSKTAHADFSGVAGSANSLPYAEFQSAWKKMNGAELVYQKKITENSLVIGTIKDPAVQSFGLSKELKALGDEGYIIKAINWKGKKATVVASLTDKGLLYGVFHLLRIVQMNEFSDQLNIKEKPSYAVRILNHWDNLDGTVERGYSGHSIWNWEELPNVLSPRYQEYARANASIGINATVLNNVNASPKILSDEYLQKVKAIAGVLRPYNMRVFLSINFSSPKELGGLATSDPLDVKVQQWWKDKANEIYKLIPDFGGFLVKANSEGLPGPMDYGRTHVDGANMLADALKPHGGIVMWRAFVYEPGDDRAKLAYKEFINFDGKFKDNVMIQVKNGPVDFQPREPFSPLFGGLKKTKLMPEFQITQEYLGQGNHLVFLSPMWKECLDSDTYCNGTGSTIAKITDGTLYGNKISAIAGVANIGEDSNWCGHHFAQANWYAFGRLAWNHELTSAQIAEEWIRMTFSNDTNLVNPVKEMMLASREAAVDYMMPMGLHHLFAFEHHYGPEPWCDVPGARPDWMPKYYHKADSVGLGFDRSTSGSNAVSQYCSPLREEYNDISNCPENLILWFHHVTWDYRMKNGLAMWDELCYKYDSGVKEVRDFQKIWDKTEKFVDNQRFREIQAKLRIQAHDAVWWKNACLLYFQQYSKRPIPYDIERPVYELEDLMKIKLNMKSHN
ncbi:MAG: alpha-glucuronidase family glycosyl hydrolase [Paludibacter sp.]